jgi:hypothetical protein
LKRNADPDNKFTKTLTPEVALSEKSILLNRDFIRDLHIYDRKAIRHFPDFDRLVGLKIGLVE